MVHTDLSSSFPGKIIIIFDQGSYKSSVRAKRNHDHLYAELHLYIRSPQILCHLFTEWPNNDNQRTSSHSVQCHLWPLAGKLLFWSLWTMYFSMFQFQYLSHPWGGVSWPKESYNAPNSKQCVLHYNAHFFSNIALYVHRTSDCLRSTFERIRCEAHDWGNHAGFKDQPDTGSNSIS